MTAAVTEPPKPAKPDPFLRSAMTGQSPADLYQTDTSKITALGGAPPPDFSEALKQAQVIDKGTPPAAPAAPVVSPAVVPAVPVTPPKVPALPAQEEWRPKGEKAGAQWDSLKTKHSEEVGALKSEIERVRKELQVASGHGSPDVEALKKELNEYRETLRDVAIERDPEFKQRFSTKENAAIEAAKLASGEHADKLDKLLKLPSSPWRDEQLQKISDDLPASSQRRLNAALNLIEQVDVERTAEIATRRQTFEHKQAFTQAQQRERDTAMQKQMETEFNSVFEEWTKPNTGHPFLTEREGDAPHNTAVSEARQLAKAIFSGQLSPKELAQAAHWAATAPLALQGWQAERKARMEAEAALDRMRGVDPGAGRESGLENEGGAPAPTPGTPEYLRYMNARLKEAQAKDFSAKRGVK